MADLVTFIVPTIGRRSLDRALDSLRVQTDPRWRAIIVWDGIKTPTTEVQDPRFTHAFISVRLGQMGADHASAGAVRNMALGWIETPWTGFLDDDDTLTRSYVAELRRLGGPDVDVLVQRMVLESGEVLPQGPGPWEVGQVGISFAMRTQLLQRLQFRPSESEDWDLLRRAEAEGSRVLVSPRVGYHVRPT